MNEKLPFWELIEILLNKKLITFGEIHGTKEIPLLISKVIRELQSNTSRIFLEIPKKNQKYIDNYLKFHNKEDLYKIPFFRQKIKDGRNSKENLDLIELLSKISKTNGKLKIFCIEPDDNSEKDYFMYKEIRKLFDDKGINIFIAGNIHASKDKLFFKDKKIIPTGYYLKRWLNEDLIVINFTANKGKFYNFGVKKIKSKKDNKEGIFLSNIKNYDLEYRINKVTPSIFL